MSLEDLRRALDALAEHTACAGTSVLGERLAIMLPDGDVAAVDDPHFVAWLVEHGEPAPFGHGSETKLDPAVRQTIRLRARGAVRVSGFDPADVLEAIEAALSPSRHIEATLTDVLVYRTGGHFVRHKDTPRSPDLVGTLIVGLPIAHAGGALHVEGRDPQVFDWSGDPHPELMPWVAVYGDVDHEVKPVVDGARVTLVYSLAQTERPRKDLDWNARVSALRASARRLVLPEHGPLMIACTRHVIAPDGAPQVQGPEALRGVDREVADALVAAGFHVGVRTCVAARSAEFDEAGAPARFSPTSRDEDDAWRSGYRYDEMFLARLERPLTEDMVARLLECITFEPTWWGDGGGYSDEEAESLAPFLKDTVPIENWVIRATAAATYLRTLAFSDDGFVGNNACDAYLYKLAALEVTR